MKDFFCNPRLTNAELYESLKEMNDFYQYSQNTIESEPKTNKDELIYVSMRGREENKEAQVSYKKFKGIKIKLIKRCLKS